MDFVLERTPDVDAPNPEADLSDTEIVASDDTQLQPALRAVGGPW